MVQKMTGTTMVEAALKVANLLYGLTRVYFWVFLVSIIFTVLLCHSKSYVYTVYIHTQYTLYSIPCDLNILRT